MAERPTHELMAKEKDGERRGKIGVAWEKPDGSFAISLNPGVVISWRDEIWIRLFPCRSDARGAEPARTNHLSKNPDEDIPF